MPGVRKGGRIPKPTAVLVQRGSSKAKTSKRRNEVKAPAARSMPELPSWTSPEARALAPEVWEHVRSLGVAAKCDALAFGELCEELARLMACRQATREKGLAWTASTGAEVQYAHVNECKDAAKAVRYWVARFGLSPSDRVGLPPVDKADDDDVVARFFDKEH